MNITLSSTSDSSGDFDVFFFFWFDQVRSGAFVRGFFFLLFCQALVLPNFSELVPVTFTTRLKLLAYTARYKKSDPT